MTTKLARSLLVVGLMIAGCGPTHKAAPADGLAAADAFVPPSDGTVFEDAAGSAVCGLTSCAAQNAGCGPIGDGCGGQLDCGSCTTPETCGGGGTLFTCGGTGSGGACTPRTCAQAGATCGQVSDGCGGLTASCGTCGSGETCGAGGTPNTCATGPACTTGLCTQQMDCAMMPKTSISGTITAPGHDNTALWGTPDPIYGALVYVPNGAAGAPTYGVMPFAAGVSCDSCSSLVTGDPLVSVTTGVDGKFTLNNAPCGTNIPLVIQLGRWRRQITIPAVACCMDNPLTNTQTHLPRDHVGVAGDVRSDIPLMAFSTGSVDTLHCVLRKIGIADTEFTNPSGTGRVRFYKDNGAVINSSTPAASTLYGSATELAKYDMAMFECVGSQVAKAAADQTRLINYANAGGRVFATHYSYVWLTNSTGTAGTNTAPKPLFQTADWMVNQGAFDSATGYVDQTLQGDAATQARRIAFAQWLKLVGASSTLGQILVNVVRQDFNSVSAAAATMAGTPAQQWLYSSGTPFTGPLHYTFDTPVAYAPDPAPTTQCGRVLYSDFHVSNATSGGVTFPAECTTGTMTAQEKTLEFMLFDLASCVGPPPPVTCTPKTCADLGFTCGESGDGCDDGLVLQCGSCPTGQMCGGGGGAPGTCGVVCTPQTCADVHAQCGIIGDGCGSTVDCGPCTDNTSCGGGGVANQCGAIF
ncbi:MAG: hypothetical protein ABI467_17800 [Kofleriaceae bacterium]